jgi:hypothetical protein
MLHGMVLSFRHFKVSSCLRLECQIIRESSFRMLAEISGNDYGFFFKVGLLSCLSRGGTEPIRSVGISAEMKLNTSRHRNRGY